jgi:membrane associated rhomboid family serine protease
MPATEMIVMVAVVTAIALSFVSVLRLLGMWIGHRTIRKAVDRNPDMAQPLLEQLAAPNSNESDERLSVILVAIGIAMVVASLIVGDPSWMHYAIAAACFPLIVGTALWLRLFVTERARRRGSAQ